MAKKQIKKIMEKETALKIIDEMKNKICDVDLDDLCGEKVEVTEGDTAVIFKRVIQAVTCGLVYWDEEEKCMVQELIHPLKSGEVSADKLLYKQKLTLGDAKGFNASNHSELMIQSLSTACGRPTQLIEKLEGQDFNIAIGCMSFFDR